MNKRIEIKIPTSYLIEYGTEYSLEYSEYTNAEVEVMQHNGYNPRDYTIFKVVNGLITRHKKIAKSISSTLDGYELILKLKNDLNIESYQDKNRIIFYIGNKELWVGNIEQIKDKYRLSLMDWFSTELVGTFDECYNHLMGVLRGETEIINKDE